MCGLKREEGGTHPSQALLKGVQDDELREVEVLLRCFSKYPLQRQPRPKHQSSGFGGCHNYRSVLTRLMRITSYLCTLLFFSSYEILKLWTKSILIFKRQVRILQNPLSLWVRILVRHKIWHHPETYRPTGLWSLSWHISKASTTSYDSIFSVRPETSAELDKNTETQPQRRFKKKTIIVN